MKRKYAPATVGGIVALLSLVPGCTSQQLASTGQAYGRNQCLNMVDENERERCLRETSASREVY